MRLQRWALTRSQKGHHELVSRYSSTGASPTESAAVGNVGCGAAPGCCPGRTWYPLARNPRVARSSISAHWSGASATCGCRDEAVRGELRFDMRPFLRGKTLC